MSKIEWTEKTWNPITGCSKISQGCKNCYADRMSQRLFYMGNIRYKNKFKPTIHHDLIKIPLTWKKPSVIFVNSMSDIFHEIIPTSVIHKIFKTMNDAHWHTFQILTKRSERLAELSQSLVWSDNIWMGVSVEDSDNLYRVNNLKKTSAHIKFLSMEPLIGPTKRLNLKGIDWVIVGGESGPGSRIVKKEWIIDIKKKCKKNKVPFFFKQWGGINKKKSGRLLNGKEYNQYPNM